MSADARSTVLVSIALALVAACSSSANNPPGVSGAAGVRGDAGTDAAEAGSEVGPTEGGSGVGLGCPASYGARAEGTPCFSVLTACDYPEGRCGCLVCEMNASSFGYAWTCRHWDSGGFGCPPRAPDLGAPCDGEGLVCRYGAYCSVSVGDDLECRGGSWQAAPKLEACGYRSCPL
jgi:hypothetical protein